MLVFSPEQPLQRLTNGPQSQRHSGIQGPLGPGCCRWIPPPLSEPHPVPCDSPCATRIAQVPHLLNARHAAGAPVEAAAPHSGQPGRQGPGGVVRAAQGRPRLDRHHIPGLVVVDIRVRLCSAGLGHTSCEQQTPHPLSGGGGGGRHGREGMPVQLRGSTPGGLCTACYGVSTRSIRRGAGWLGGAVVRPPPPPTHTFCLHCLAVSILDGPVRSQGVTGAGGHPNP